MQAKAEAEAAAATAATANGEVAEQVERGAVHDSIHATFQK